MKSSMVLFFAGLLSGIIIFFLVLYFSASGLMMKENKSAYGFDESVSRLEKAIGEKGYKIPAVHDLQATMIKHGKEGISKVSVYEICNPDLAEHILRSDDEKIVSNMMPCRIAVYERQDGYTYYSRINAGLLSHSMGKIAKKQMSVAAADVEEILTSLK